MLRTGRWRELLTQLAELFKTNSYSSYDVMIVVPPGATLEHPAIGPHLLAAWAKQAGFRVAVFYANVNLRGDFWRGRASDFVLDD